MSNNRTVVLLLLQSNNSVSVGLRQLFRQLSLLWKFEIDFIDFQDSNKKIQFERATHIVVGYFNFNEAYEKWCCNIINQLPSKTVLLLENAQIFFGQYFKDFFGVTSIESYKKKGQVNCTLSEIDAILANFPENIRLNNILSKCIGYIKPYNAVPLIVDQSGSCFLSKNKNRYCLSITIWQFGVPTFPVVFRLLRNFLFFSRNIGHLSPFPFVSVRVDDYPITSQQYISSSGVNDTARLEEIENMMSCATMSGAQMEFMVCSKVFDNNGVLKDVADVVPKSLAYMKNLFKKKKININAHGKTHLDENRYFKEKEITPFEFSTIDKGKTELHLLDNIHWIKMQFHKRSNGFVPPSWGYNRKITKQVCSKYFDYVIDSSQNFSKDPEVHPLGYIDKNNLIHLIETWHLGSDKINYSDASLWQGFLDNGIPIHMMVHGPYLYGVLPRKKIYKYLLVILVMCGLPIFFPLYFKEIIKELKLIKLSRKWGRLEFINKILVKYPYFKNATLPNLLMTGKRIGVNWCFTEDLSMYLRYYKDIKISEYTKTNQNHWIKIHVGKAQKGPVLLHMPFVVRHAAIDRNSVVEIYHSSSVKILKLQQGVYRLTIQEEFKND